MKTKLLYALVDALVGAVIGVAAQMGWSWVGPVVGASLLLVVNYLNPNSTAYGVVKEAEEKVSA